MTVQASSPLRIDLSVQNESVIGRTRSRVCLILLHDRAASDLSIISSCAGLLLILVHTENRKLEKTNKIALTGEWRGSKWNQAFTVPTVSLQSRFSALVLLSLLFPPLLFAHCLLSYPSFLCCPSSSNVFFHLLFYKFSSLRPPFFIFWWPAVLGIWCLSLWSLPVSSMKLDEIKPNLLIDLARQWFEAIKY